MSAVATPAVARPLSNYAKLLPVAQTAADQILASHGERHEGDFARCIVGLCRAGRDLVAVLRECGGGTAAEAGS